MSGGLAIPRFEPEVYFAQRLEAYGVFVDRFGTCLLYTSDAADE